MTKTIKLNESQLRKLINEMGNSGGEIEIDVDVPDEFILSGEFARGMKEHNLSYKVETWVGPGGGNPLIYVKGPLEQVKSWFVDIHMGGDPYAEDEFSEIYL